MMNKLKHTIKLFIVVIVCALSFTTQAQQTENGTNYFQLSPRIGYDFPSYNNNTPAIDYKGHLLLLFRAQLKLRLKENQFSLLHVGLK